MVEKDRRIAKESPQDRLRKIKQTPQGQEMLQRVASAEHPFQEMYKIAEGEGYVGDVDRVAQMMIQRGITSELDFIIEKYPERFRDWVERNDDVRAIVAEFGWSNKWLSWALAQTYQLSYDNVYRASKTSTIRRYIGDITVSPRETPFWDDKFVNVRSIQAPGVDFDLRRNSYIERDFNLFSQNAEGYLAGLQAKIDSEQDERLKRVLAEVYEFYDGVKNLELPALKSQITDDFGQVRKDKIGREISFPSNHQKAAIVKAAQEGSMAIFDGTGSGKTAIGIGLAEYTDAQKVLVISPASVKQGWEQKIKDYYQEPPQVLRLESQNTAGFLKHPENSARYTVVNYELLIDRNGNGRNGDDERLSQLGQALLMQDFDLLIVDEAHYINNPNKRSDAILELCKKINRKLLMTATPVRNSAEDVSRIAHLLSPNDFITPDALRRLGPSGVPVLVDLLGTKTLRRKTEDLFELPAYCPETGGKEAFVQVELNPTQKAAYDAIFDDPSLEVFTKIKLLRQAAIDHNLVLGARQFELSFKTQEAKTSLEKAYKAYKKQKEKGQEVTFNSDFLVLHGFKHLFLGTHFKFRGGINKFIEKYGSEEVKENWQGIRESSKFTKLRELISQRLSKGEKVVVFSGHYIHGITREIVDDVSGEKIMQDLYSYLKGELSDVEIGRIDGEVSPTAASGRKSKREERRQKWQKDPNFKILLTTVSTSALGIDFSINDRITKGVSVIGIDLPYTYADFWQMTSRVYRLGQATSVQVLVLESENTIDEGIRELIYLKDEIGQQLLDGLEPNEIEKQRIERGRENSYLKDYLRSPKNELEKRLISMRGKGISANGKYLETVLEDGKTVGQILAELYSRYWEYTTSGHNARLVRQTLDALRRESQAEFKWVVDAGSGPLILERVMKQESEENKDMRIISIDINRHMLENGIAEMENLGYEVNQELIKATPMSETQIKPQSCDAVVCSLAFQYSNNAEDRAKILKEANRILKIGGYYLITLPESSLEPEQYIDLKNVLSKFGFEVNRYLSGKAKATDYKDVPFSVWLLVARKVSNNVAENLTDEEFRFKFEAPKVSHYQEKEPSRNGRLQRSAERLVKHENFVILDPEENFRAKGSPDEVLARLALGLTEANLKRWGWSVETRDSKEGTNVILRK